MKKGQENKHHTTHANKRTEQKEVIEKTKTPNKSQKSKKYKFNPFKNFSNFIKQKFHKSSEPNTTIPQSTPLPKGPPPKLELSQELKQLVEKQDDAVNKLYQFDILLRKYYSKEYKIGKKLTYSEMVTQLEEKNQTSAADLIKKIIEYAYSGKPLEDAQMNDILSIFRQLMIADIERKRAEKESHQKDRFKFKEIEQEVLADKLMTIAPQLPPSTKPFLQMPVIDLQKYSSKLRELVNTIKKIRPRKMFARAQLPKTKYNGMPQKDKSQTKDSQSVIQSMNLPELRLPNFSDVHLPKIKRANAVAQTKEKSEFKHKIPNIKNILHVKRFYLPKISVPHLELPKIALPYINSSESHSPHHKLPPFRVIGKKISQIHLPTLSLPNIKIPHPKIKMSHIRKILHLPKFHPTLYLERIKEHIPEIHPSEYINTVIDNIPRLHPSEYYVSIKEKMNATWENIHPPKQTEEELALQAELKNEENQEPPKNLESEEETYTKIKLQTPKPILTAQEKYWIEYKPRSRAQKVEHHFAYEIDDVHHIRGILKKHHKSGLI